MKSRLFWLPNCITCLRIAGAAALLAVEPFSAAYYILYTLCGISDVADGTVARRLKITSSSGALLDSIADLVFYSSLLLRLVPHLFGKVSVFVWYFAGAVVLVRIAAYTVAAVKYRRFASVHTFLNKATGFSVFCTPYLILFLDKTAVCAAVCTVGLLASFEELVMHIKSQSYDPDKKSLLFKV